MATIKLNAQNKILTKNGKVSCGCCGCESLPDFIYINGIYTPKSTYDICRYISDTIPIGSGLGYVAVSFWPDGPPICNLNDQSRWIAYAQYNIDSPCGFGQWIGYYSIQGSSPYGVWDICNEFQCPGYGDPTITISEM